MSQDLINQLAQHGVVPVVVLDSPDVALPLADALLEGGLPVVEITFRTAAAAEAIRLIRQQRPDVLVGAGTVLNATSLAAANASGAAFGVAPGLNPEIVREAQKLGLPFIPGVATPSEIEQGLALGCKLLKFFPAEALGGVAMLEALAGPFKHTGLRFMPSGGLTPANIGAYLKLDIVTAVGGTWLAKKEDFSAGDWQSIRERCRAAVAAVKSVRG